MTIAAKDFPEVIEFLGLFAQLREWCDDQPARLADFANSDSSIAALCEKVHWAAWALKRNERRRRELFAAPVDPKFIRAWREFEERYEAPISNVWLAELVLAPAAFDAPQTSESEWHWRSADSDAERQAEAVKGALDFAQEQASQDWRGFPEELKYEIDEGIAAWEELERATGFDLRGIFRRRELIPFVLVPREVAARYGPSERLSLLRNLQQAHDAFVFGALHAALSLMRSIAEAALRDLYKVDGIDRAKRIDNAKGKLPPGASPNALHRLRRRANAVLHLDAARDERLAAMDDDELAEKEVVSLLLVLRALIEGAGKG